MIIDISGNSFSIFDNQLITRIYNPQQIFGDNLNIWYDFSDTSILFTNTGATTNVSNSGDIIRYVTNKAKDKNYNLTSSYPSVVVSGTSTAVTIFNKNSFNSNKHSGLYNFTGSNNSTGFGSLQSISATTTSSSTISAVTISGVIKLVSSSTSFQNVGGFQQNKLVVRFLTQNPDTTIQISIMIGASNILTFTIPKQSGNNNMYYTITIDSTNTLRVYLNNNEVVSTTVTGVFPLIPTISADNGKFYLHYNQGVTQSLKGASGVEMLEYVCSFDKVLTDNQVFHLHNYYVNKYNILSI